MSGRRPPPVRTAVVLSLSAFIAGGCATSVPPTLPPSTGMPAAITPAGAFPGTEATAAPISALLVTSTLWPGTSDLLFSVLDPEGRALADAAASVVTRLQRPDGTLLPEQAAQIVQPTPGGRRLYQVRVDLDEVGSWQLHVRIPDGATATDGSAPSAVFPFDVIPDDGSPPLGAPFPAVETPTAALTAGGLTAISSLPEPEPAFYERSVPELLERGEPFLLSVDSVAFRTTDTCGAGLGHLIHLHHEVPAMRMVHAEPYVTSVVDGVLTLDPPDGPPQPAPWAEALGATSPPWIFVVDRDGRLWAKFHGIFGSDELRSAIDTVLLTASPGTP